MRATSTFPLSAAVGLVMGFLDFLSPVQAEPAYSVDTLVAVFVKDKAVAEAYKIRRTRDVCLGGEARCPKKQAPAPTNFDLLVNFQSNSAALPRAAKDNLRQFAKALMDPRLKGEKFAIDGHTSAVGAEEYNLRLSERRAGSVVTYLASQGVDSSLLLPKGFGATELRVADPHSTENNRIEAHLIE